ncbi:hypothetical protein [Rhodopila sp.]|uniref:hypothetical protein n=1 Tax=Rhodopila sp. TaxID=2480087 RepID=UPI003D0D9189
MDCHFLPSGARQAGHEGPEKVGSGGRARLKCIFGSAATEPPATTLEASGDAIIRAGLRSHSISARVALMLAGAVILYGYGLSLNLAPLDWGRLIGAYVATFFVVGQIINLVAFGTAPTLRIIVGGLFILTGGAIITLWQH